VKQKETFGVERSRDSLPILLCREHEGDLSNFRLSKTNVKRLVSTIEVDAVKRAVPNDPLGNFEHVFIFDKEVNGRA
jgi:hypothetical protein